jgi:hypothetical protein
MRLGQAYVMSQSPPTLPSIYPSQEPRMPMNRVQFQPGV